MKQALQQWAGKVAIAIGFSLAAWYGSAIVAGSVLTTGDLAAKLETHEREETQHAIADADIHARLTEQNAAIVRKLDEIDKRLRRMERNDRSTNARDFRE